MLALAKIQCKKMGGDIAMNQNRDQQAIHFTVNFSSDRNAAHIFQTVIHLQSDIKIPELKRFQEERSESRTKSDFNL